MTRRDFELIARVLARTHMDHLGYTDTDRRAYGIGALRDTAVRFVEELERVNPNFDRARFMRACGFGEG